MKEQTLVKRIAIVASIILVIVFILMAFQGTIF